MRRRWLAAALVAAFALGCMTAGNASPWRSALGALENAQNELESADPLTEGHRERAIALVQQAISEVEAAISEGR